MAPNTGEPIAHFLFYFCVGGGVSPQESSLGANKIAPEFASYPQELSLEAKAPASEFASWLQHQVKVL